MTTTLLRQHEMTRAIGVVVVVKSKALYYVKAKPPDNVFDDNVGWW